MIQVKMIPLGRQPRRPRRQPKVTLRTLAKSIAILQVAEGMDLHAQRDSCVIHAMCAAVIRDQFAPVIPNRLRRDRDWMHRHIEAPGVRIQARMDDHRSEL